MFLLIEPSIFIRLSSVIPFWKAEGLTILMVWINFDEKLWPMRNQHLKIGYPSGCNFWLRPRIKKILSQNTPFLHDIFGTSIIFFNLGPLSPPKKPTFWIKHLREKLKKVNPYYFSILNGVSFLHFFPKTPLSASNCNFSSKCQFLAFFGLFEWKLQFEALRVVLGKKWRKLTQLKIEK